MQIPRGKRARDDNYPSSVSSPSMALPQQGHLMREEEEKKEKKEKTKRYEYMVLLVCNVYVVSKSRYLVFARDLPENISATSKCVMNAAAGAA